MDFQAAEARLRNDHNKLRSRTRNRNASRTLASSAATSKAKKAEEYRKKQLEKKKLKDLVEKNKLDYVKTGFEQVEKKLGLVRKLNENGTDSILLEAVSVHGLGDKITLPASILGSLASRDLLQLNQDRGQPLFFRVGIRNENYAFPQSDAMLKIMEAFLPRSETSEDTEEHYMSVEDDEKRDLWIQAYLEELSCEYVSYSYATVVEFSQDEGFIGLPSSVCNTLLQTDKSINVESKLTIDPSNTSQNKDVTMDDNEIGESEVLEEKTPGHAAYGMFPVPLPPIEVTLLTHLPMGEKCTLQPTVHAIENGFYNLKNVKLALEQSLIRTRGSLNEGGVMYCWFRGKKFDLNVQKVFPADVGAISCVNCDIEVDIAPPPLQKAIGDSKEGESSDHMQSKTSSGGYKLSGDSREQGSANKSQCDKFVRERNINLLPEPSGDHKDLIITVQIKGGGKVSRRRFLLSSSLKQLFDFAICERLTQETTFKLVTRFPRRIFRIGENEEVPLEELGLSKQEAFVIES